MPCFFPPRFSLVCIHLYTPPHACVHEYCVHLNMLLYCVCMCFVVHVCWSTCSMSDISVFSFTVNYMNNCYQPHIGCHEHKMTYLLLHRRCCCGCIFVPLCACMCVYFPQHHLHSHISCMRLQFVTCYLVHILCIVVCAPNLLLPRLGLVGLLLPLTHPTPSRAYTIMMVWVGGTLSGPRRAVSCALCLRMHPPCAPQLCCFLCCFVLHATWLPCPCCGCACCRNHVSSLLLRTCCCCYVRAVVATYVLLLLY